MTADMTKFPTATRPRYGCLNDSELAIMTAGFTSSAFTLPFVMINQEKEGKRDVMFVSSYE